MQTLNIHEAKTKLSAVLQRVESGEKFLICRNGQPIAELVPHEKRSRLVTHPTMRKIRIDYDPTETMTEEEWGTIE